MGIDEMREPTFLVLAALADGAKHGYALIHDIAAISEGRVTLRAGTLYAALDRLTGEGLVRPSGEEVVDGRLRRYYDLTDTGADVLAAQVDRLRSNAAAAERRLRSRPGLGAAPA
ncbi:putative transcriptional regulator [Frankia canadensis]|uniref:Putative transcriptional regulator n=1 Tax=Frankia canadensis TaxID=1836972 RepID=A0A2I2KPZ0_9ACTN|nr:PadR family transcriptional regulator [Frankia canadensis]SNQ47737.1 putative transcriptional regulator [Frankia canadensis]SOU55027.1 putative transcriptional regulator [Frankia canadensis]